MMQYQLLQTKKHLTQKKTTQQTNPKHLTERQQWREGNGSGKVLPFELVDDKHS